MFLVHFKEDLQYCSSIGGLNHSNNYCLIIDLPSHELTKIGQDWKIRLTCSSKHSLYGNVSLQDGFLYVVHINQCSFEANVAIMKQRRKVWGHVLWFSGIVHFSFVMLALPILQRSLLLRNVLIICIKILVE